MRKIELIIARMLVKITFYLTYLFRIKKQRISIISYFNDQLGLEYTKLNNELIKKYEVKYDLRKFNNTYWGKLQYLFSFIYQTYLFNTSAIVILDGNSFVLSTIKKKPQVKTIQIWHAIGAIKDFGSKTRRRYQIKDYDYLITSSPYFSEVFAQRLNTDINHCYDTGYIKSDYLFDKDFISKQRTLFYDKYPQYLNKKLILYAPTFRGEGIEDIKYQSNINELKTLLDDDMVLLIKKHPLIKTNLEIDDVSLDDLYQLLIVADIVISDYSALVFDSMILNKKIILYLYDLISYQKERGLCLDINDLNVEKASTIKEVYDIIAHGNEDSIEYEDNKNKYLKMIDGKANERLLAMIDLIIGEDGNVKE